MNEARSSQEAKLERDLALELEDVTAAADQDHPPLPIRKMSSCDPTTPRGR